MMIFTATVIAVLVGPLVVEQAQCAQPMKNKANNSLKNTSQTSSSESVVNGVPPCCFPAVGFEMPNTTPTSLTNWWCNTDTEYAFVGFSYDISLCDFLNEINVFFCDAHRRHHFHFRSEFDATEY
jgi:hypothetical protein